MQAEEARRSDGRLEVAIGDNPELSARLLELKARLEPKKRRSTKTAKESVAQSSQEAKG